MARTAKEQDEAKDTVLGAKLWPAAKFAAGREAMSAREANLILSVVSTAREVARQMGEVATCPGGIP